MARTQEHGDHVTLKDLYETLKEHPTRRELRLTVGLGLVGGQVVASLVTAYVTRLSPVEQAQAAAEFVSRLF